MVIVKVEIEEEARKGKPEGVTKGINRLNAYQRDRQTDMGGGRGEREREREKGGRRGRGREREREIQREGERERERESSVFM